MIGSRHIPPGPCSAEMTGVSCPRFPAHFTAHPRQNERGAVLIDGVTRSAICRVTTKAEVL